MAPEEPDNDAAVYPGILRPPSDGVVFSNQWRDSVTGDRLVSNGSILCNTRSVPSSSNAFDNKVTDVQWPTTAANAGMGSRNESPPLPLTGLGAAGAGPCSSRYDWRAHSLTLCRHILTRGLADGVGSDIAVHVPAWGKIYHLHRLILDQNQYFSMLLQGGFREATSDSVTLHFENSPHITEESFYFVLTQLYGKLSDPNITTDNVRQILATCSFFQLEHMCELCVDFILRSMNNTNVVTYLTFADKNMVHGSDRILNAVFTFLCREAYSMDIEHVADIPLPWLKKVIECDAFWVPTEYDRYKFAYRVLLRHHELCKEQQQQCSYKDSDTCVKDLAPDLEGMSSDELQKRSSFAPSPVSSSTSSPVAAAPTSVGAAARLDDDDDDESNCNRENDEEEDDLTIFLRVFTHALHYMHMTFEQLEQIRSDTNPFTGESLVPDDALKEALWQQIKMRSKIEGAGELDTTLGLTIMEKNASPVQKKELLVVPTDDTTIYTGESSFSATNQDSKRRRTPVSGANSESQCKKAEGRSYSLHPPFRFSVEFADFATLKHNVRIYSKTVFYAGSNWNMYIQKARSQRKGVPQLGVYLHRQSVPCGPCNHNEESRLCTTELSPFSCFADKRKVVRTWFKIYCPARGPKHTLTLFQSSPDNFSVLQSWGWRSTTLCADESLSAGASTAIGGSTEPGALLTTDNTAINNNSSSMFGARPLPATHHTDVHPSADEPQVTAASLPATSSNLRFSIVMGHV